MIKHLFALSFLLAATTLSAQVSVNQDNSAPDPSAMLDVKSSDKGMLMPRMTTAQRDAIANPAPGLVIYNTQDSCFNYYTGTAWVKDCGRSLDADQVPFNNNKAGGSSQDEGYAIDIDSEGNVYVTGYFQNTAVFGDTSLVSNGSADVFVAKYGASGQLLWVLSAGGDGYDFGKGISVDAAGNCYVTGQFRSTAAFGNTNLVSNGSSDIFVAKYSASGQLLWAVQGGGTGIDDSGGISIDASDNIYVTGDFQGAATFGDTSLVATGFPEVFVAKYTPSGQLIWALNAGGAGGGGTPQSIDVDAAGNWYVAGYFFGTVTFGNTSLVSNGSSDVFVAKYSASGQLLWAVQGGGTNTDSGAGISVDATGNCYVTGRFTDTATFGDTSLVENGNADIFVVKYDPSGQVLWAQRAGGTQFDDAYGISTDPAGNAYVTGHFNATASFGDTSLVSNGNLDIFVAKYAPSGQFLWAKSAGGGGNDKGASIALDASGNAHVTGAFVGTVTFDNTTLTSSGAQDMFVWSINSSGGGINNLTNLSATQDLDPDPANELQELSLSGTTLSISNGNSIDLAGIDTDTDNQTLGLSGTTLSISNGNSVDLVNLMDDNDWTHSGNNIYNANSGNVGIGTASPTAKLEVANSDARINGLTVGRGSNGIGTNTALGAVALSSNSTGSKNTAFGVETLSENISGSQNTASGYDALRFNYLGDNNTASGVNALLNNYTGSHNTANGSAALIYNILGNYNTAMGENALISSYSGDYNTGLGYNANVSAINLTNATAIGANATVNVSNKIRLGDADVTVIEGQVAYTFPSDGRFKTNVSEEVKGLDFITRLRPVVYNFDTRKFDDYLHQNMPDSLKAHLKDQDYRASTSIRQSGFIAQEVEAAMRASGYDFNGLHRPENQDDYYTVAYSQFVVPLVKAVQEQQEIIKAQQTELDALKAQNTAQQAAFEQRFQKLEAALQQLNTAAGKSQESNEK